MYKKINILISSFIASIPLFCFIVLSETLQVPKELPDLSKDSINQLYTFTPILFSIYILFLIVISPIVYFICVELMKFKLLTLNSLLILAFLISSFILGLYLFSIRDFSIVFNDLAMLILLIYTLNFTFFISFFISLKILNRINPN